MLFGNKTFSLSEGSERPIFVKKFFISPIFHRLNDLERLSGVGGQKIFKKFLEKSLPV